MKKAIMLYWLLLAGAGPAAAQKAEADRAPPGGVEEVGEPPADEAPGSQAPAAPGPAAPRPTAPGPAAPANPAAPPNDISIGRATAADKNRIANGDVLEAAEGVFGRGAAGLAGLIEDILRDQGEPIGYIAGREAGGALGIGAKYGSGTLFHKIEGQRKVYWRGPSIGFDAGADANKVFVLVYNLDDGEDLFKAYPAAEGRAYFVGGFAASYLKRKDVVLIPVRLGAGVRLGANVGYMRFSKKGSWLPF